MDQQNLWRVERHQRDLITEIDKLDKPSSNSESSKSEENNKMEKKRNLKSNHRKNYSKDSSSSDFSGSDFSNSSDLSHIADLTCDKLTK